mmetsp:Transcript_45311/g.89213  ORF Transcript_45311/g.89213 Transcript_45311/m.89213 type:complete len:266 (-) Transcript_45311:1378-2175(-)
MLLELRAKDSQLETEERAPLFACVLGVTEHYTDGHMRSAITGDQQKSTHTTQEYTPLSCVALSTFRNDFRAGLDSPLSVDGGSAARLETQLPRRRRGPRACPRPFPRRQRKCLDAPPRESLGALSEFALELSTDHRRRHYHAPSPTTPSSSPPRPPSRLLLTARQARRGKRQSRWPPPPRAMPPAWLSAFAATPPAAPPRPSRGGPRLGTGVLSQRPLLAAARGKQGPPPPTRCPCFAPSQHSSRARLPAAAASEAPTPAPPAAP